MNTYLIGPFGSDLSLPLLVELELPSVWYREHSYWQSSQTYSLNKNGVCAMNIELTLDPQFNPQSETKIHKSTKEPWNKGKLMGQKPPLKLKEVWEIRVRLQLSNNCRELALFNLAIDSKLRGCDLVKLKVRDVAHGDLALKRAMVMQQKTHQPVQFEITEQTRNAGVRLDQTSQIEKR